ncbi:hypothetical protein [Xanthomonas euvesicatoria]|uniref:hypothetical protein n=1 Tax=Xanthomonas euvesicatoria TaxID=456327 RepID=UPI001C45B73D|nr:hypothetical protein [Xanthomonas euvesicatoria]MBV6778767.1 hypothetical protein [Xanthomonas campestris pv. carissae]
MSTMLLGLLKLFVLGVAAVAVLRGIAASRRATGPFNARAAGLALVTTAVLVGGAVLLNWRPLSDKEKAGQAIAHKAAEAKSAECQAMEKKSMMASTFAFACMDLRGRTPAGMQLEKCQGAMRDWNMLQIMPKACLSPLLGFDPEKRPPLPAGSPAPQSVNALNACKAGIASLHEGQPWPAACGLIVNWTDASYNASHGMGCTKDELCI